MVYLSVYVLLRGSAPHLWQKSSAVTLRESRRQNALNDNRFSEIGDWVLRWPQSSAKRSRRHAWDSPFGFRWNELSVDSVFSRLILFHGINKIRGVQVLAFIFRFVGTPCFYRVQAWTVRSRNWKLDCRGRAAFHTESHPCALALGMPVADYHICLSAVSNHRISRFRWPWCDAADDTARRSGNAEKSRLGGKPVEVSILCWLPNWGSLAISCFHAVRVFVWIWGRQTLAWTIAALNQRALQLEFQNAVEELDGFWSTMKIQHFSLSKHDSSGRKIVVHANRSAFVFFVLTGYGW